MKSKSSNEKTSNIIETNNEKWVSELIGNEYKNWNDDRILIGCGTGKGKTTFALKHYAKYMISQGKRVVYICNRISLKEQINIDIEKYGVNVDCISYQKLASDLWRGNDIPVYDAYICDESHYFYSDSSFNLYTDVVYNYLMDRSATVIYMTATYDSIFRRLRRDTQRKFGKDAIEYYLPSTYDYVDNIYWFSGKSIRKIIDMILEENPNDKIIYFCNSITKMQNLYNEYSPDKGKGQDDKYIEHTLIKDMVFKCSGASKRNPFIRKVNTDNAIRYDKEVKGYTFDSRILVTTKVLDNGIDFKDKAIKHIICDVFDVESAIQCLGRKRSLDPTDTCNFYVRNYQSQEMNLFLKNVNKEMESPETFRTNKELWEQMYGSDRSHHDNTIYYDASEKTWKLNELRYEKLLMDRIFITEIESKRATYRNIMTEYMGEVTYGKHKSMEKIEKQKQIDSIEIYLKDHVDIRLTKDQQKELVVLCNIRDRFNRLQKSIGIIQNYLEDMKYPYTIASKREMIDGLRKTSWIISKK